MSKKVLKIISVVLFFVILVILSVLLLINFNVLKLPNMKKPEVISLNQNMIGIKRNENYQLVATVYPSNVNHGRITYISSNPEIASVNETTGYVTAHKNGSVTIKAMIERDNLETDCNVVISDNSIVLTNVTLTNKQIDLMVGKSFTLKYKFTPSNATIHNLEFISSDNTIIQVNEKGTVIAKKAGKAIVTIFDKNTGIKDEAVVNVHEIVNNNDNSGDNSNQPINNETIKEVKLSSSNVKLVVGGKYNLKAEVIPQGANQTVTWTSLDENVALVNDKGVITGKSVGSTKIVATAVNGVDALVNVTVQEENISLKSINIKEEKLMLDVGDIKVLSLSFTPSNATNQSVVWNSSDEGVVNVSDGKITAIKEGQAIITVMSKDGNFIDKLEVVVNKVNMIVNEQKIVLSQNNANLNVGGTVYITANVKPDNATYRGITWSSSDSSVASVSNGLIVGKKAGTAVVTVTSVNRKITAQVNVKVNNVEVDSIKLNNSSYSMHVGDTKVLVATVSPSEATNKTVIWTSSDTSIATVNSTGVVTGVKAGTVTITAASNNGKKATCTVSVAPKIIDVTSVSLNKTSASIMVGATVSLTATVSPSEATNKTVIWTSSDTSIATVNSTGVVTGVKAGTVTITAASNNGKKATCTVIVINNTKAPIDKSNIQSGYSLVTEYTSSTLKYWIERGNRYVGGTTSNEIIAHIWVKNAYDQLKTAIPSSFGNLASAESIMSNEISKHGYQNKGLVAVNGSGFVTGSYSNWLYSGTNGIPEWKNTSVTPVVIVNGQVLRNFTSRALPSPLYNTWGLKKDGWLENYQFKSGSENITYNQNLYNQMVKDGVKYTFGFSGYLSDKNGNILIPNDPGDKAARTLICEIDENNFILASLGKYDLYNAVKTLTGVYSCKMVLNLDGGGSRKMYYKLNTSNNVTKIFGGDRMIADMVYFSE